MRRTLILALAVLCVLLGLPLFLPATLSAAVPADPTLAKVHAAWAARQEKAATSLAEWTVQLTTTKGLHGQNREGKPIPPNDATHPIRYRLSLQNGKARLNRSGVQFSADALDFIEQLQQRTLVGSEFRQLWSDNFGNKPRNAGFVNDTGEFDRGDWSLSPIVLSLSPLATNLGGVDLNDWKLLPQEQAIEGTRCLALERTILTNKGTDWGTREYLYLANSDDYRVLRRTREKRKRLLREQSISYKPLTDRGLFCTGWTAVESGTTKVRELTAVTDVAITLDPAFAPGEFQLGFPPSTMVTHRRTGGNAIALDNGELRPVSDAELSTGVSKETLMTTPPLFETPPVVERPSYFWCYVACGALVAVGLIWRFGHYRR